jgi:hypothetical protein
MQPFHGLLMPSDIPEDLREFVTQQIDSIAQLEALLLLRDHAPEEWSSDRVAARLYVAEDETARLLADLHQKGFLNQSDNRFSFSCRTPELETMVTRVAQLYRQKLIPVTNLIHSKQKRIQQFADAFRLRKEG